jgi:transposase-like protein
VERREALLDEFERSGASAMAFAKMAGINYATFANWRQKRRKAGGLSEGHPEQAPAADRVVGASRPMRLFEAFVEHGGSAGARSAGLTIELRAGARLVVESPIQARLAAELLGLLEQSARRAC